MYITISPQKIGKTYSQSSASFVEYLEKENEGLKVDEMEHFFNQYGDEISAKEVISNIDGNTAKLKKAEPKFYSITVNPSKYELKKLENESKQLREYTRLLMKEYAKCFNRTINDREVSVRDIVYFAKIEHQRNFKGTDRQIRENQPFATKILNLKNEIQNIKNGYIQGDIREKKKEIERLEREAPHQQDGKRIVQGMKKPGSQSHIHIIVSRKDASNSFSLSPGSKHKSSEVKMHGKIVRRGFDRDQFYERAEKTFDTVFSYKRNYAETYRARKEFVRNPSLYFAALMKLPPNERSAALKLIGKSGAPIMPNIPTNQAQLALRIFKRLRRGLDTAIKSSSIGI
ncbi:MobB family relaxase [Luteirhabdus pelagi]|uniref:MobB family relaxase n=1 Tax=Luteirhabdus pelagi TaxID=2792783 RepID=UPI001939B6D4|nr:MobB family relaxase [Luteirhabdus pelagi]